MSFLEKLLGDTRFSRISSVIIAGLMSVIVCILFYHYEILKDKADLAVLEKKSDVIEADKAERRLNKLEQYHKDYIAKLTEKDYKKINEMVEEEQKAYEYFSNLDLKNKSDKDNLKEQIEQKEDWLKTIEEKHLVIMLIIGIFLGIVLLQISRLIFYKGLLKLCKFIYKQKPDEWWPYKWFDSNELKPDYYYIGAGLLDKETYEQLIASYETYAEICYTSIIPIIAWGFYLNLHLKNCWWGWYAGIGIALAVLLIVATCVIDSRKYEFLEAYLKGKGVSLEKFSLDTPYVVEGKQCQISTSLEIKDISKYSLKVHPKGQTTSLHLQGSDGNTKNLLLFEIKWDDTKWGNRTSCLMEIELLKDKETIPLTSNTFVYFSDENPKPSCNKVRYKKETIETKETIKIEDDLIISFKNYKLLYSAYPGLEESIKNSLKLVLAFSDTTSSTFITFMQDQYIRIETNDLQVRIYKERLNKENWLHEQLAQAAQTAQSAQTQGNLRLNLKLNYKENAFIETLGCEFEYKNP